MKRLNDSPTYRKFVNERDDALERILDKTRLRLTELTDASLVRVIEIIKTRYNIDNTDIFAHLSKKRFQAIENEIEKEFEKLTVATFQELVSLRKKTYLLSYLGEFKAIQNSTTKVETPKLTKKELEARAINSKFFDDVDPIRKIRLNLAKLCHKIMHAIEMASLLSEDVEKAVGRVYMVFPKVKTLPKKAALKRVKVTEADKADFSKKDPRLTMQFGWEIDSETWDRLVEDYLTDFIPEDRGPASFFDIKNPYTDEVIKEDVPPEERYYEWEITRDVNSDFVQQVRAGQIEAANQNGIDEFVVISVIDDRTCESCCGEVGCVDFDGKFTSEVEEMTDGEYSAPPYHFNCVTAGHLITTDHGQRLVEEIKPGDFVLTHKMQFKEVERFLQSRVDETLIITLENGIEIECTPDHPFLVDDKWIVSKDLKEDDYLTLVCSELYSTQVKIENIKRKNEKVTVYNFSVKDDESYIVNGIISHNCRCTLAPASTDIEYKSKYETTEDFNSWLNS